MVQRIFQSVSRNISLLRSFLHLRTMIEHSHQLKVDEYRRHLLKQDKYDNPKNLNRYEMKVLSQNGEDGIIREIFHRIGAQSKVFVEIGAGDGRENNTSFLLLQGWSGFWIEGNRKAVRRIKDFYKGSIAKNQLKVTPAYVSAENITGIINQAQIPIDFDLLSLDIDLNTYWLWNAIIELRPRVVVVEYNANFPPDVEWVVEYDAMRTWDKSKYFGASLKAYERLGRKLGYHLVGCDLAGVNAFFVKEDLTGDCFDQPFTAENHYEPARYFLT